MVLQIFVSAEPLEAYKAVWKYVYIIMFYRKIYFLILCVYITYVWVATEARKGHLISWGWVVMGLDGYEPPGLGANLGPLEEQ